MKDAPGMAPRHRLLRWMDAALAAVDPATRVSAELQGIAIERAFVLAIGKAAAGMASGAQRALGDRITGGMIIAPRVPEFSPENWQCLPGGHPVPDENSLRAGEAIESALENLEPDLPLLVLLSGGGSALAELPVTGLTLADLQRINRWLLGSGLDIHTVNAVRARFSRLKRGGMLRLAGQRKITGLLISDVPGDHLEDIASGPLSFAPCDWPAVDLPSWLEQLHTSLPLPAGFVSKAEPEIHIVARNDDALDAIEDSAELENIPLVLRSDLSGSAAVAGREVARLLCEGAPGLYLFGGETSVRLPESPESPGRGGRNQHLALAAAKEIAGDERIHILSFGTDGVDGNTNDAGAVIDGHTSGRIRDAGLNADECLARADSNAALLAAGDVIHTGPTGTNVADIVIGLKVA